MTQNSITRQSSEEVLILRPSRGWSSLNLADLWRYRELIYFLIWRDIKVRYKQTALGASWAIIQPFMTMVVFTIFFGGLAKMPSDNIPYPICATFIVCNTFNKNTIFSTVKRHLVSLSPYNIFTYFI